MAAKQWKTVTSVRVAWRALKEAFTLPYSWLTEASNDDEIDE